MGQTALHLSSLPAVWTQCASAWRGLCHSKRAPPRPAQPRPALLALALELLPQLALPCIPRAPQIMDLLGFEPSPWNKINIHIGG